MHRDGWSVLAGIRANMCDASATVLFVMWCECRDDIWQYCGDTTATNDINWYTKRAMLTGVYTATEVYVVTS